MRYRHHNVEYEIDDAWLREAGVSDFIPKAESYRPGPPAHGSIFIVRIDSVEPLTERANSLGVFCDDRRAGTSAKDRVLRILRWFGDDHEVEPVQVVRSKIEGYEYKLVAGCHRFHCAHAMGFRSVPAVLGFDMSDPRA